LFCLDSFEDSFDDYVSWSQQKALSRPPTAPVVEKLDRIEPVAPPAVARVVEPAVVKPVVVKDQPVVVAQVNKQENVIPNGKVCSFGFVVFFQTTK
jgi:hypothetical protein